MKKIKDKFLNLIGHKNSPMITVFICIIICLILISHGQSKNINVLEEKIENQHDYIGELNRTIESQCQEEKALIHAKTAKRINPKHSSPDQLINIINSR